MKLKHFILFIVCTVTNVFGQKNENYISFIKQANKLYQSKNYEKSVLFFEKAFKIYDKESSDLYNAACSASLNLDIEKAKKYLTRAIDFGWSDIEHLHKDPDLYSLHCLETWKSFVKRVEINKKKYLNKTDIYDKIKNYIQNNDYNSIYKLTSTNFRSKAKDLKNTINTINQLLKENNIKYLQKLDTGASSSTSWINGVITETLKGSYTLIPKYLNGNVSSLLLKPLGYKIKVNLLKEDNKWLLSNLILENKYADLDYNMSKKINTFFTESDSLLFGYTLKNKNQKLYNNGSIKSIEVNDIIINELKELDYINFPELKNNKTIYNDLAKTYSLTFYSKKKRKSNIGNNPFIKESKKELINTFEFIFYDNNSNIILISNGYKYGFYKINSIKKLKEIISNKITDIYK